MARFLDTHEIGSFAEADILELRKSPYNEFKVKHVNMLYNPEADLVYCLLEAPSKEAIEKHHAKLGSKCDSIIEIKSTT